jgi:hypothetical protein
VDGTAPLVIAAAIFCWGAVSARLERADLTAPIVFTAVGAVLAAGGLLQAPAAAQTLKPLVELTLVYVLFSDAARVGVQDLRVDAGRYVRLLAVGLPLTVLAGWRSGSCPAWASGLPCSWLRRWRPPTLTWAFRW